MNACKYLCYENLRKYFEMLILWFIALKNDWRIAILLISSAILSLYTNLTYKTNRYYLKVDEVLQREPIDVSSAIVSMESLLRIEQTLVQALNEHANKLQERVNEIRIGLATMRRQREIYSIDAEEFLGKPLHSFPMLRRLKHEWKAWLEFLQEPQTNEFIEIIRGALENVNDYDLTTSAEGIQQLCELYDIEPNDWINGKLHLDEYDIPFSTLDCYAIAFLLYKQDKHEAANEWFEAALTSFKPRLIYNYMIGFTRTDIYETYVENLLKQNRINVALEVISQAVKNEPTNSKLLELMSQIKNYNISMTESNGTQMQSNDSIEQIKRGCRGDFNKYSTPPSLYCYYNWSTNDFVRLAPFKVEIINVDPIIMLYHEVLNDFELQDLKTLTKQELKNDKGGALKLNDTSSVETNSIRSSASKNVWLEDKYNNLLLLINERIEDMTALQSFGSNIMLGNYGLGGCSTTHTDCKKICENVNSKKRDDDKDNCDARLATILIYLTDVKIGGSTIFPELDISVTPSKGCALLWYNFQNDMNACDNRTLHMACPVVVGSKWFLIKWINRNNQMFRKPCLA